MITKPSPQQQTVEMLHELGFPVHRIGYKQLCIAIPYFALDDTRSITKEVYPYLAEHFQYPDCRAAESAIRDTIHQAWTQRDPVVWKRYFSNPDKQPTNKGFIATLAERLK